MADDFVHRRELEALQSHIDLRFVPVHDALDRIAKSIEQIATYNERLAATEIQVTHLAASVAKVEKRLGRVEERTWGNTIKIAVATASSSGVTLLGAMFVEKLL